MQLNYTVKSFHITTSQDANAALQIVKEFKIPAAVAVKHMNPCGVGTGSTIEEAFDKAYEADSTSIFGGIVALNREVDAATAEKLSKIFFRNYCCSFLLRRSFRSLNAKEKYSFTYN